MKRVILVWMSALTFMVPICAQEFTSYPMVLDCNPLAAQVGTTSEHVVKARYGLAGAFQVLVTGRSVNGEVVEVSEPKTKSKDAFYTTVKLRFTVAEDAMPGVRDFRVATPHGASTLGQLVVVRDPVVVEDSKKSNDTPAGAVAIELPAAVCGAIEKAEDVDYYKFHAKAGESLVFNAQSSRCEDRIHDLQSHSDPILTLRNSQGTVLGMSDNFFRADPLLMHRFEHEGDYTLEIRDVRYQSSPYWQYVIQINDRSLVTNVFPLALVAERPTRVELVGFNLPKERFATVTVAHDLEEGPQWVELPQSVGASDPVPVVVSRLPLVAASGKNTARAQAQQIEAPAGINGRLSAPGEMHYFTFDAKKGERFTLSVIARCHESALDPVISIFNEKNSRLVENDDFLLHRMTVPDPRVENWTAPADGRYTVEVRDLQWQGGPEFVYYLAFMRAEPGFELVVDGDKLNVPAGGAATIFVRAFRKGGFTGEIQLAVEGAPKGMRVHCGRILAGENDGSIVIESGGSDAKPVAANLRITGIAKVDDNSDKTLTVAGRPWQETYMPGGGRGMFPVEMFTVVQTEPLDVGAVKIAPREITLKPGESKKIEVTVERAKDFSKNVTLDVAYRHGTGSASSDCLPKGVTVDDKKSKSVLTGTTTTGYLMLTAAKDAKPVEKQQVSVLAKVSINFVMSMTYSSAPLLVTVTEK
ncbi:MAG TPA: hypothetical protein VHZ24_14875 [Pirellulales bacterium]|jgi:ribosomal protein L11|nr:hypothetical protein [Pirellulales bacterium]